MRKIYRILGLSKLFFYRLLGWNIIFDKTIFFHPLAQLLFKNQNAHVFIGQNVCIDSKCKISINEGGRLSIGDNVVTRENVYIEVGRNALLDIEKDTFLNRGVTIVCMNKIKFKEHIAVGNNALFFDHDHLVRRNCRQNWNDAKLGEIEIGRDTWIAANTLILRNSNIGNNCIIGGGVVFKGNLKDNMLICSSNECYKKSDILDV